MRHNNTPNKSSWSESSSLCFPVLPCCPPLLRMQLPRNPWVTLRKGVSSLVDANNTEEKNNKCRTICLMKSLTFYFISPYCILKEVNRKTFANYTTVYWLLGRLLLYLSEVPACPAVPASASSRLLCARGAQQQPWVLSTALEPLSPRLSRGVGHVPFLHEWERRWDRVALGWCAELMAEPAAKAEILARLRVRGEGIVAVSLCGARILCPVPRLCIWAQ